MRQYEVFELTFDGENINHDWADADINAIFKDPNGEKKVKGFYAGEGKYKVRYLPEAVGPVSWKVSGAVNAEGCENCEPADETHHGIVRAEKTHLKFSDNRWFFSFGTTVYALAHQDDALTEKTFETLANSPFNKVRMCIFPKHYDYNLNEPKYFPFEVNANMHYRYDRGETFNEGAFLREKAKYWNVKEPNFDFWNALEEKITRLEQMDIQVDLILFHPYDRWGFSYFSKEQNRVYLDYAIRRLSAFPNIWWSLANEYDLCGAKDINDWHEIENFVAENDPYHHLLSNHNCIPAYDFTRPHMTHCSLQKRTMGLVPEYMRMTGKPVLYDECAYEGNLKQTWGSISGEEMSNRFWKVMTHGGYCTHGEVYLDENTENLDEAVLWWAKGGVLKGTSPQRIAFLRDIIEEIGQPLEPYQFGLAAILNHMNSDFESVKDLIPETFLHAHAYTKNASLVELKRHEDAEMTFAGHAGEDAYLFYYGTDCCARVDIEVSNKNTYRIDVIDTWNMTRETVLCGVSGQMEVRLTGRPYMAILAVKESL